MRKIITGLTLLSLAMLMTACSQKPVYVQQPFLGFTTYPTPGDINITVERGCIVPYETIEGYKKFDHIGDCVRVKDVKKLAVKIKRLEKIAENYELDIKAYLRLNKKGQ